MAFRHNKQDVLAWRRWRARYAGRAIDAGVQALLLEEQRRWWYFLDHGYYTPEGSEPILNFDRMDEEATLRLCLFLEELEQDEAERSHALRVLQHRLGRRVPD